MTFKVALLMASIKPTEGRAFMIAYVCEYLWVRPSLSSHTISWNSVTWMYLTTKEFGKYRLNVWKGKKIMVLID